MVLKNDTNVLFIVNEFIKVTNNNKLTPDNIQNIVKAYKDRTDKDYMVKVAS